VAGNDQDIDVATVHTAPTQALIALIESRDAIGNLRVMAAEELGARRSREAFPALVGMLADGRWAYSVAAAEALVELGDPAAVVHLQAVYAECQEVCRGTHLHWDDNRLYGILIALLRFRSAEDLQRLQQEGDPHEQWAVARILEMQEDAAEPGAAADRGLSSG